MNPAQVGTKSAAHYKLNVGAGKTATIRLRLSDVSPTAVVGNPFNSFAAAMKTRQDEADQFYRKVTPSHVSEDEARVLRQSMAGMLWSKQFFFFDVDKWLTEHGNDPMKGNKRVMRNANGSTW